MPLRVYVASSWRNGHQQAVVAELRRAGHEVYDFRAPEPGNNGFSWSAIDPNWQAWSPEQYAAALNHPIARAGFALDMNALRACDACVLVLPCGRSAHLELGYAVGAGKVTAVLMLEANEPELMNLMVDAICQTVAEVLAFLSTAEELAEDYGIEPRPALARVDREARELVAEPCELCRAGVGFKSPTGDERYHVVSIPAPPGAATLVGYSYRRCTAKDGRR